MTNPTAQAASIVRASPGTIALALVGLTAMFLALDAARWGAKKLTSTAKQYAPQFGTPNKAASGNAPAADNGGF